MDSSTASEREPHTCEACGYPLDSYAHRIRHVAVIYPETQRAIND